MIDAWHECCSQMENALRDQFCVPLRFTLLTFASFQGLCLCDIARGES